MLDVVVDDREEMVITRVGREPAVVVSLNDYESIMKTAYPLRSPANARRLLVSVTELVSGDDVTRDLLG